MSEYADVSRSDEWVGWWQCSDGDVFSTRDAAVDHLRLVEVEGSIDRLRRLPDGGWEEATSHDIDDAMVQRAWDAYWDWGPPFTAAGSRTAMRRALEAAFRGGAER